MWSGVGVELGCRCSVGGVELGWTEAVVQLCSDQVLVCSHFSSEAYSEELSECTAAMLADAVQFKDYMKHNMEDAMCSIWWLVQELWAFVALAAAAVWYTGVAGGQDPGGKCTADGHGATGGYGVPGAPEVVWTMQLAIAAKLVICIMNIVNYLQGENMECMNKLVEKSTYMERRLMKLGGNEEDVTRMVANEMRDYDGEKGVDMWLVRRLRAHCSAWTRAIKVEAELEMKLWYLACTEVQLRWCRDIVLKFVQYEKDGASVPEEKVARWKRIAANMQLKVEYWYPLSWSKWNTEVQAEMQETAPVVQQSLLSQLKERGMELGQLAAQHPKILKRIQACVGRLPEVAEKLMEADTAGSAQQ